MTNTIFYFALIILAVFLGTRWNINIGLIAGIFAFALGTTLGGLSAGGVVALFPTSLFFNYLLATFLFGFAVENGTLKTISGQLIYRCRNSGWVLGVLFFVITAVVAALGAGGGAPFFMSALCFPLAIQAGMNPLLVPLATWMGPMVGASFPWTAGYATNVGQLEIYFETQQATGYVSSFFMWRAVFYTIVYLVLFVALKGYRVKTETLEMEQSQPLNSEQKNSLSIILGVIGAMVIFPAMQMLIPNPVTIWLGKMASFQQLALVGIVLNLLLKTADYTMVLKERIPWDTLLMLSFTGMYMALGTKLGIVDYMSHILQNSIPSTWIIPAIVLIMSVLSFFVSGGVVMPAMLPLISVLASASGASVGSIYCATQIGLTASSISPFSQGGAAALSGCPNDALRKKLMKQQTVLSGVMALVVVVIAMLGGFSMMK